MSGVSKRFGGAIALDDVHLDLMPGEVHALMGENGAGKSTLMKILSGVYSPDSGNLELDGVPVTVSNPRDALSKGIAIIHQELNTVPEMTVAENLALGNEPGRGGILNRRRMNQDAKDKLSRIGADIPVDLPLGRLSVGMQQMVEIARAVAENAKILVLDEPTASLSQAESDRLFGLVEEMRDQGMALVYISHRMEEVWKLADRITVLRDGRWVSTTERNEVTPEDIVNRMVGRDVESLYINENRVPGDVVLSVRGLSDGAGIGPVDLDIRSGEVVGLVGLVGAGRTEIARMIFGADSKTSGSITLNGKAITVNSPGDAIKHRIGLLPESRKEQALFPEMSIRDNTAMSTFGKFSSVGVINRPAVRKSVLKDVEALRVRSTSIEQTVGGLSGGNQQKVILARCLMLDPELLILDEPTRGVDIGAKQEIYRIINDLVVQGVAVLVISSDLPEALGISDRIIAVRSGKLVKEFNRDEATENEVMLYATGVATDDSAESRLLKEN
ncbi:sugar ABC transporter ATP-binding protein [Glutamicibacter nicotianae]